MGLQRQGPHACAAQLLGRATSGREAFHPVTVGFSAFADDGERRRLSRSCDTIKPYDLSLAKEYLVRGSLLRSVQLRMPVQRLHPSALIAESKAILAIALLHPRYCLSFHPQHGGGRVLLACRSRCALDRSELPLRDAAIELRPHLAGTGLSHAAVHGGLQDRSFVLNSGTLKGMIASVGDSLLSDLRGTHLLAMVIRQGFRHNPIGLMAVLRGKLAVPVQHLGGRLDLFGIACPVSRYLSRSCSLAADFLQV